MNKTDAIINALMQQRNQALDACVLLSADLVVANERIKELETPPQSPPDPVAQEEK